MRIARRTLSILRLYTGLRLPVYGDEMNCAAIQKQKVVWDKDVYLDLLNLYKRRLYKDILNTTGVLETTPIFLYSVGKCKGFIRKCIK